MSFTGGLMNSAIFLAHGNCIPHTDNEKKKKEKKRNGKKQKGVILLDRVKSKV
jgi:hypothetical protein